MKKNWTLRAGVLMLALTLITSCFVGGTFAKYTTADEGTDTARVAKFGVDVVADGTTFAKEYAADDTTYTAGVTVKADTKVVAPGTSGDMVAVQLSGTPEVAVEVTYEADVALTGNWMAKDNAPEAVEAYYCPLKITINTDTLYGMDYASAAEFATAIKEKIDGYSKEYAPGTDLSGQETENLAVSWAWDFNGTDNKQTDVKDTYLGDKAAEDETNAGTISLTVNTIVTQID